MTDAVGTTRPNPEAAVVAAIDALDRDGIDELVDWQMTDSPAARTEHGAGARVRFYDRNGRTLWSGPLDGPVFDLPDAPEIDLEESWGLQRVIGGRTRRLIDHLDERVRGWFNEQERERVAAQFSGGGGSIDAAAAATLAWHARVEPPQFPIMGGGAHYSRVDDETAAALAELAATPTDDVMAGVVAWGRDLRAARGGSGPVLGPVKDSGSGEKVT